MDKLSEKIINKIKEEGIKPRPRWEFLLKDSVLWVGFCLSVLMGSISMALIYFLIKTGDLDIYNDLYGSVWGAVGSVIPYFWILILLIFGFGAYLNYKKTDGAYKHKYIYVFLTSLFLSMILGAIFFASGMAKWLHCEFMERMPFYAKINIRQEILWMRPETGFLMGIVVEKNKDKEFKLLSPDQKIWLVDFEKARVSKKLDIEMEEMVKVLGKMIDADHFEAVDIRPFERSMPPVRGMMMERKIFVPAF